VDVVFRTSCEGVVAASNKNISNHIATVMARIEVHNCVMIADVLHCKLYHTQGNFDKFV